MSVLPKSTGGSVILCELSPLQKTIYQAFLEQEDFELIATSQLICSCGSGEKQGYCCRVNNKAGKSWFHLIPSSTALLLKCANHLALVFPSPNRPGSEWVSALFQKAFLKFPTLVGLSKAASILTLSDIQYCGKIKVLKQMLTRMKQKCMKVLLCIHSRQLLCALEEALLDYEFTYTSLDNRLSQEERDHALAMFHRDTTKLVLLMVAVEDDILPATLQCDVMIIFDPCLSSSSVSCARTCPWCVTDFHPVYKLIASGTVEEVLYIRQTSQMGEHSLHAEYSVSSPSMLSYSEAFTLHSSPVSASLPDWKVTSKIIDGVALSQLTFLGDSGVGDRTSHAPEWGSAKEHIPPACTAQATCFPQSNEFEGASSESDDLGNSPVAMKASTAPETDGDVQPHADNKKQGKKVTRRLLRPQGPIMQRKKRVCRGLVYESDHEENTAIQKRSTASKKRRNHACALPKTHLTAVPYKQPMDEGERPLDAEPVARESLLPPNVMVEPSQLHDTLTEPFDVRGSVDLFTSDEEVPPVITEQASPTVNMDELFGF